MYFNAQSKVQNVRAGHFESFSSETGLSPPVKNNFTDRSKAVLLWWVICVISVLC